MGQYVLAIDQGTTSTRAIIFDRAGSIVSSGQLEHAQILPRAGWVEHDPTEIWDNTREVIGQALSKATLTRHDIAAVGITNQRETAVVWDQRTGEPVYNAIVWPRSAGSTASPRRSACPWPPISRVRRSPGSWRTSRARAPGPRPETWSLARRTRGCSGT
jgi:glycerol kinase